MYKNHCHRCHQNNHNHSCNHNCKSNPGHDRDDNHRYGYDRNQIVIADVLSFAFNAMLKHISLFLGIGVLTILGMLVSKLLFFTPLFFILVPIAYVGLDFGLRKVTLEIYDRGNSSAEVLFSCFGFAFYGAIAYCVYFILSCIGLVCLIIPGIIIQTRCMFFPLFILDKNAGPIEALQMSWHATRNSFWSLAILWIMVKLFALLGVITIIGWIFMWPFSTLVYAAAYRHLVPFDMKRSL